MLLEVTCLDNLINVMLIDSVESLLWIEPHFDGRMADQLALKHYASPIGHYALWA